MSSLYIVATPIGNSEDIGLRALKIILYSDIVLAEDTRRTGMLIGNYKDKIVSGKWQINGLKVNQNQKFISFYDEVEGFKTDGIITEILSGKSVCLVSDSGTPLISDPGFKLIRKCIENGINLVSIPGPTAVISALVCSGLPANQFLFLGYPPVKTYARQKSFSQLNKAFTECKIRPTVIFYESPHRILKTLTDLRRIFGDIKIVICRELTKMHEEIIRDKISNLLSSKSILKGELCVIFQLNTPQE